MNCDKNISKNGVKVNGKLCFSDVKFRIFCDNFLTAFVIAVDCKNILDLCGFDVQSKGRHL